MTNCGRLRGLVGAAEANRQIAAALLILLLAGLRNAWDMMLWIVIRLPGGGPPPAA
jgi:hypothetical protein